MAKKILTVAELEAKKSELEDQIADIEDQIEEAMKREQKNRYAKIKSDKKDLLKLAKETFENLDKIEQMMEWKDDKPLQECNDCSYNDWDYVCKNICPLAPICCYLENEYEVAHNLVAMMKNIDIK